MAQLAPIELKDETVIYLERAVINARVDRKSRRM
jgi:hypothetical protein